MKNILLGATAALALAAPGVASAESSGYIDMGYQNNEFDSGSEFDGLHLGAGFYNDFGGWGIQADGQTTNLDWDGSSGNDSTSYAAVHAFTTGGSWDFGGYVGLLNYYGDGGYMVGGETRTNFGNFSLEGTLGYADFDQSTDYNAWDVAANGAYFFMPNFAVTGTVAYTEWDAFFDYDATTLSLGGAYQFGGAWTVYGGYSNVDVDSSTGSDYESDVWRIGFRYNIGGGDLQTVTNDGASWSGGAAMHERFLRW